MFTLVGLGVFDAFVIADRSLAPDVRARSLLLRLGLATPLMLCIVAGLANDSAPVWRELSQSLLTVAATGIVLHLMLISHSPLRGYQHYGIGLILLYPTFVQRIHFRYLAGTIAVCFLIYAAAVA